jgi:hypothetical protein
VTNTHILYHISFPTKSSVQICLKIQSCRCTERFSSGEIPIESRVERQTKIRISHRIAYKLDSSMCLFHYLRARLFICVCMCVCDLRWEERKRGSQKLIDLVTTAVCRFDSINPFLCSRYSLQKGPVLLCRKQHCCYTYSIATPRFFK